MTVPGLLFMRAKPTSSSLPLTSLKAFLSETFVPAMVDFLTATSTSSPLVLRYDSIIPGAAFPCIILIRLDDVESLTSQAWQDVLGVVDGEVLRLGNELIEVADNTEWKARVYELAQRFTGQLDKPGRGSYMVTAANEPAAGLDDEFDEWYRKQHLDMLSMVFGFRRSTRYKLLHPFPAGSIEAPALTKTLTADSNHLPFPVAWEEENLPRYLAIHEWDNQNVDKQHAAMPAKSEWAKRIVGSYRRYQREDWTFAEAFGEKDGRL